MTVQGEGGRSTSRRWDVRTVAAWVAVLAVLGAVLGFELRASLPEASQAAGDTVVKVAPRVERQWDVAFDRAMVEDRVEYASEGMQRIDVALVNATPGADLQESVRACAREFARAGAAIYCYAFASRDSYDYKNLTAVMDVDNALVNLCWATRAIGEPGEPIRVTDAAGSDLWKQQGCPA